jgi:8-oxo-dGTP diphosphatase
VSRFCGWCGHGLNAAPPTRCGGCGRELWANAKPCAAALILDASGRVLLTRRAVAPWRDLWCAPSGFCDGPEHPIDAAEREVLEEVGLSVRVTGYLGTWIDPYGDAAEPAEEYVSVQYYAAELSGDGEPTPDAAEVSEARWFSLDATPTDLAVVGTLTAALEALRVGPTVTPLPDRPRSTRR